MVWPYRGTEEACQDDALAMVSQAPGFVLFSWQMKNSKNFHSAWNTENYTNASSKQKSESGYLLGIALGACGSKSVRFTAEASIEELV